MSTLTRILSAINNSVSTVLSYLLIGACMGVGWNAVNSYYPQQPAPIASIAAHVDHSQLPEGYVLDDAQYSDTPAGFHSFAKPASNDDKCVWMGGPVEGDLPSETDLRPFLYCGK